MPKRSSLWAQRKDAALQESFVDKDMLEEFFKQIETRASGHDLDLDSFEHVAGDEDFEYPSEQDAALRELLKSVKSGGDASSFEQTPSPAASSSKLQVTVQEGIWDLLNNWASAEDRDLSAVTNVAIEAGLRALRADGAIPKAALDVYEAQCKRRIAIAQARAVSVQFILDLIF